MSKMKEVFMRDRERMENEERLELLKREDAYLQSTRGQRHTETPPKGTNQQPHANDNRK